MEQTRTENLTVMLAHPGRDTLEIWKRKLEEIGLTPIALETTLPGLIKKLSCNAPDLLCFHILLPSLTPEIVFTHPAFQRLSKRPAVFYVAPENANPNMLSGYTPALPVHADLGDIKKALLGIYPPKPNADELLRAERILEFMGFAPSPARKYLSYASSLLRLCPENVYSLSKTVLPETARAFSKTPRHVNDAMRRAADKAFLSGDIEKQYALFGNTIDDTRGKPTVSALLARISEMLRFREDDALL